MNDEILRDAYAVLFPAIDALILDEEVLEFFRRGTLSILLGETREEYKARRMSDERIGKETENAFTAFAEQARLITRNVIIGIDQEPAGIQRLHNLVPVFPDAETLHSMKDEEIVQAGETVGRCARRLGINLFLAPIVDVVRGPNPWLAGRNLGSDPEEVARISSCIIRGVQRTGIGATAKHFPGHHITEDDPAVSPAFVPGTVKDLQKGLIPFQAAIEQGVKAVMLGPAVVPALDLVNPSSVSRKTVDMLRDDLGFKGLIMSDGLEAKSITRDNSLGKAAVDAVRAGVDLLLLSAGPDASKAVTAIADAVNNGSLSRERLAQAAGRVRNLAALLNGT